MILTYLRWRIAGFRRHNRQTLPLIWTVVKYIVLIRFIFVCEAVGRWPAFRDAVARLVSSGALLSGALVAGAVLAHFEFVLAPQLPLEPFRRFGTDRRWALRALTYPIASVGIGALFLCSTLLLRSPYALILCLYCYLAYMVSWRVPALRIVLIALAAALSALSRSTEASLAIAGVALGASAFTLIGLPQLMVRAQSARPVGTGRAMWLRKEVRALRYFSSDQYFIFIGLLFVALVVRATIADPTAPNGRLRIVWLIPWLGLLPFARIVFNLFGTDLSALSVYMRSPGRAIQYQAARLRLYSAAIYTVQFACAFLAARELPAHAIGVMVLSIIAFTEAVMGIALLYSIVLMEQKVPYFLLTQNFGSRNTWAASIVYLTLTGVTYATYLIAGATGLIAFILVALACQLRLRSVILPDLLEWKYRRRAGHA